MRSMAKRDTLGSVLIEFAVMLPIMILVFFGLYEGNNYLAINARLDEIASRVASWSSTKTTRSNINDCLIGSWLIGQSYNFSTTGQVIVSGLTLSSGVYTMVWQVKTSGAVSSIVTNAQGVVVSSPITFANTPKLIVVEVKYPYQPFTAFLSTIFKSKTIYKTAQTVPLGGVFNPLPA